MLCYLLRCYYYHSKIIYIYDNIKWFHSISGIYDICIGNMSNANSEKVCELQELYQDESLLIV